MDLRPGQPCWSIREADGLQIHLICLWHSVFSKALAAYSSTLSAGPLDGNSPFTLKCSWWSWDAILRARQPPGSHFLPSCLTHFPEELIKVFIVQCCWILKPYWSEPWTTMKGVLCSQIDDSAFFFFSMVHFCLTWFVSCEINSTLYIIWNY